MDVSVTPWSEALESGMSAQKWAKQAMIESKSAHPHVQLILLRQALSTDPETRRWLQDSSQNGWTAETLLNNFVAKFCSSVEPEEAPQEQSSAPWMELPSELLFKILSYLPPSDLANCARVCRTLRTAANDDALWRALHIRSWGDLREEPRNGWRKQFTQSCFPASRSDNIRVRLDQDIVWSGQATPLTGEVYLRLSKPVLTTGVVVNMFGFEKSSSIGMHSSNSGRHVKTRIRTHLYFDEQKRFLCPHDETDYLNPKPKPITLAAGLYTIPFRFLVPSFGIQGRVLQRTFWNGVPLLQIAYGVTATLEVVRTSTLDSLLSVFSSPLSFTAPFSVDRFYDRTLLRPEPVSVTGEMTFMFGGPINACLVVDCATAVSGGQPFSLKLQVDNRSNYDVQGATVALFSWIRVRALRETISAFEWYDVSELNTAPTKVASLPCPFIQAPSGVSTAWNFVYPVPPTVGPSIQHATYFELNYRLYVNLSVSYTLTPLTLSLPVVITGPNFAA